VRLAAGSSPFEGRLELFHNGEWGTVCGFYFTDTAAQVACDMLGFGYLSLYLYYVSDDNIVDKDHNPILSQFGQRILQITHTQ